MDLTRDPRWKGSEKCDFFWVENFLLARKDGVARLLVQVGRCSSKPGSAKGGRDGGLGGKLVWPLPVGKVEAILVEKSEIVTE